MKLSPNNSSGTVLKDKDVYNFIKFYFIKFGQIYDVNNYKNISWINVIFGRIINRILLY